MSEAVPLLRGVRGVLQVTFFVNLTIFLLNNKIAYLAISGAATVCAPAGYVYSNQVCVYDRAPAGRHVIYATPPELRILCFQSL